MIVELRITKDTETNEMKVETWHRKQCSTIPKHEEPVSEDEAIEILVAQFYELCRQKYREEGDIARL